MNNKEKSNFLHKRSLPEMYTSRAKSKKDCLTPVKTPKSVCIRTPKEKCVKFESIENKDIPATPTRSKLKVVENSTDVRKICVAVRFRPMNSKEVISGGSCPFRITGKEIVVNNSCSVEAAGSLETTYSYDHVFWSAEDGFHNFSSQKHVFEEIALPLLDAALEGYNACLFTYGQTGSGKTYSMMGCDYTLCGEGSGIIPRFCNELLNRNKNKGFTISMSYYEIYNEKIHDLLSACVDSENKTSLRVREHPTSGPYVENLTRHRVDSLNELNVLLAHGNRRRATSATLHNNHSSRSHAILEVCLASVSSGDVLHSKVSLVDLAGSERVASSFVNEERFKEGLSINKSLLTLGKVITSLSDLKRGNFIPYRESVLTWLLKESLGGNSRTVMLATVSPSTQSVEETLSTLRYACQARHILNRVALNEDPQLKVIRELREEVERLRALREDCERNEPKKLEKCNETRKLIAKTELIKYQNDLLNIEMKQRAVEEELHIELSRLGMNLAAAEKRKNELENQQKDFLKKLKREDVPLFESNFFENLQDILSKENLNESRDEVCGKNELILHLQHLNDSLNVLRNICERNSHSGCYKSPKKLSQSRSLGLLETMSKCHKELCEILHSPSPGN